MRSAQGGSCGPVSAWHRDTQRRPLSGPDGPPSIPPSAVRMHAVGVDVAAASYWTVPASGSPLWGFPLTQDEPGVVHTLDPVWDVTGTQQPSAIIIKASIFELEFKDS